VIRRLIGLATLLWLFGFAVFMLTLPKPLEGATTDAIVVPTGAAGRIDRGLELIRRRQAHRLLISGVALGVDADDLAEQYHVPTKLFGCCVDLGTQAADTRGNAEETARWVRAHHYHTIRLVTSDWHMARARMELDAALADDVVILADGVPSEPRLGLLVNEYTKLLLRRVALWTGVGA